jgi:hypothetical protein
MSKTMEVFEYESTMNNLKKRKRSQSPIQIINKRGRYENEESKIQESQETNFVIKFQNSKNFIFLNKKMLSEFSGLFHQYFQNEHKNEVTINEDELIFSECIQYIFTGELNIYSKSNPEIIQLFLLINKVNEIN